MYSRILLLLGFLSTLIRRCNAGQRGQTGMEVAVVGVVCATCVLGGVLITTSEEAAEQLESVFQTGIEQASGTLVLSGGIVTTATGDPPTTESIVITLATIGKPAPVNLDAAATEDRMTLSFVSAEAFQNDIPYTATELRGNGDGFLQEGETAQVTVLVADIAGGAVQIGPMQSWTLHISAPSGGELEVTRTMPFALNAVNSLR